MASVTNPFAMLEPNVMDGMGQSKKAKKKKKDKAAATAAESSTPTAAAPVKVNRGLISTSYLIIIAAPGSAGLRSATRIVSVPIVLFTAADRRSFMGLTGPLLAARVNRWRRRRGLERTVDGLFHLSTSEPLRLNATANGCPPAAPGSVRGHVAPPKAHPAVLQGTNNNDTHVQHSRFPQASSGAVQHNSGRWILILMTPLFKTGQASGTPAVPLAARSSIVTGRSRYGADQSRMRWRESWLQAGRSPSATCLGALQRKSGMERIQRTTDSTLVKRTNRKDLSTHHH